MKYHLPRRISGFGFALAVCAALAGLSVMPGCAPTVVKRTLPVKDTVKVARVDTTFDAKGITPEGEIRDTLIIRKQKVHATEYHALLPFIFFGKDSSMIPARYVRMDKKKRTTYQIGLIPHGNTLQAYYHILNIIGKRLKDNSKATVTLTGCRSQFETDDSLLTKRRAEAVRQYLIDYWRINTRRIKIVASDLPSLASLSEVDTLLGAEENQRVEISSDLDDLLSPIALPDTVTLQPVGLVRFFPPQISDTATNAPDAWSLSITIGDSVIKDAVTGSGSPPTKIDFPIDGVPDLKGKPSLSISSTITMRDTSDMEVGKAPGKKVFIREVGVYEEEFAVENNQYVHSFNLLLFGFDSASVFDFSRLATGIVKEKIQPNSSVRITGHTDKTGLPYYNKRLSLRRAEFARDLLGTQTQATISGVGESEQLYDQTVPEGRYYSRTVTIDIATPVNPDAVSEQPAPTPVVKKRKNAPKPKSVGGAAG